MLHLNHKKLNVWESSIDLVTEVYALTEKFPNYEIYGLTSQLRRAAISVPSNIAEGSSRSSRKDRKRFYEIARSSLAEIDTQIEIALKLNFCTKGQLSGIETKLEDSFAMMSRLISSTKTKG